MHQQRAAGGGFAGEDKGGQRVEGAGELRFAFGLVHGGVGGGIDDEIGGHAAHGGGEAFRVGEVTGEAGRAVVVEGHELTQRGEAALEFPADLAVLAEEKDFHGE
jgi:hypothetical protein